jgi:hypothetical protein
MSMIARRRRRWVQAVAITLALGLAVQNCFAQIDMLIITYPPDGSTLANGATFNDMGYLRPARHKDANNNWVVDVPNVLCELYFNGSISYLMYSTTSGVSFADNTTVTGTFNGTMTAKRMGDYVSGYSVEATGLDPLNQLTDFYDIHYVAIGTN